ncbi:hypothetical protein MTO96_021114 [Rhipicephalus appendiculatus]
MDPNEGNVDSNGSASDQETLAGSGEPGAHQHLQPQSEDTPTVEGDVRGPDLESVQSEESLRPVGDSPQQRPPRSWSAQNSQDAFRRDRASSSEDRTTDPMATNLARKPLSQAYSADEIMLAALRLAAIRVTHTRARSEGQPMNAVAVAQAAATLTMEHLHMLEAATVLIALQIDIASELYRQIIGAPSENEVSTVSSTISSVRSVFIPRILLWTKDGQKPVFEDNSLRETGDAALWNCSFPVRYSLPRDPSEDIRLACFVTKDHSQLSQSDAILFDASTISTTPLPRFRDPRQVWVFYTHRDSAPTTNIGYMSAYSFNWTMAQRTDADVVIPFGNWTLDDKPASRDFPKKMPRKDRTALFFASDCDGQKTNYVLKAVLSALEGTSVRSCGKAYCGGRAMCLPRFQEFRFLFVPQSSGCHEHPLEAIYDALKYDLVPVYFGTEDLTGLVPEHSYVSAYSLMPVRNITQYLRTLMGDFDLYSAFFKWRETHVLSERPKLCYLCDSLRRTLTTTSRTFNVLYWWKRTNLCPLDHKPNQTHSSPHEAYTRSERPNVSSVVQ